MNYKQGIYLLEKVSKKNETFDFIINCPEIAGIASPGQFVHIKVDGFYLRRPISICQIIGKNMLRIVFQVRGEGTAELSKRKEGGELDIIAPLGNGFTLLEPSKKAVAIGGGIGVPPLVALGDYYNQNCTALLGFRNKENVILEDEFAKSEVYTDDGSYGIKGYPLQGLEKYIQTEGKPDIVYACGPDVMLKAVRKLCLENEIKCELSLEQRMGCGVGACVGCSTPIYNDDGEVTYKCVCKDGPVFPAERMCCDE